MILAVGIVRDPKRRKATLSALSFSFAQTNGLPLNPVGTGVLDCPPCCSLCLSASTDVRTYQKPSSERKGDHEVVEGACVTIKIVLSSPLRTLPQSLRDSSLSEGAFEKVAAILFCSLCLFLRGGRGRSQRKKTENCVSPSFYASLTLQYSLIFLALSSPSTLIKLLIPSYPADM